MIATVYLSARFQRRGELNLCREQLGEHGIGVTSRWLTLPTPELTEESWSALAVADREDIERADAFILFAERDRDGAGGRHVEFGIALALHKSVIVVGRVENLFQRLPGVRVVETWEQALKAVLEGGSET